MEEKESVLNSAFQTENSILRMGSTSLRSTTQTVIQRMEFKALVVPNSYARNEITYPALTPM